MNKNNVMKSTPSVGKSFDGRVENSMQPYKYTTNRPAAICGLLRREGNNNIREVINL